MEKKIKKMYFGVCVCVLSVMVYGFRYVSDCLFFVIVIIIISHQNVVVSVVVVGLLE